MEQPKENRMQSRKRFATKRSMQLHGDATRRIAITPVEQTTQVGSYRSFSTPSSYKAWRMDCIQSVDKSFRYEEIASPTAF